jgi:uncharacterized protein
VKGPTLAPSRLTQSAEEVAEAGYLGLMAGHRTIVPGVLNKFISVLIRLVPRRIVLAAVDARQARRRSAQRT